jgi:hypothetical protein
MAGAIAQDRESCQFPFVVDEKPAFVPGGLGGAAVGGARSVPYGAARSHSERAAPSARVGERVSALRLSGINRIAAPAHAAGRGSVGRDG